MQPAARADGVPSRKALGPSQSCISLSAGQALTSLSPQILSYRRGGTIWINHLPRSCAGIRPFNTLLVETHGSQICRGDSVRALERPGSVPGPVCVLGDFVPYPAR